MGCGVARWWASLAGVGATSGLPLLWVSPDSFHTLRGGDPQAAPTQAETTETTRHASAHETPPHDDDAPRAALPSKGQRRGCGTWARDQRGTGLARAKTIELSARRCYERRARRHAVSLRQQGTYTRSVNYRLVLATLVEVVDLDETLLRRGCPLPAHRAQIGSSGAGGTCAPALVNTACHGSRQRSHRVRYFRRRTTTVSVLAGSGVGSPYISHVHPADSRPFAAIHRSIARYALPIWSYAPRWTHTAATPLGVSVA